MSELTSAAPPPVQADDHVRGEGQEAILYLDLGCSHCAAAWGRLGEIGLRLCFRHFPLGRKHRRAEALHAAAEAAACQGEEAFWGMVDATYADHARQDDPHLWQRATELGLDLERFERDRRAAAVGERVRRDFESGIRAGVVATPTAFTGGRRLAGGELLGALATMARD
jgi:protein-disulfide isomerase